MYASMKQKTFFIIVAMMLLVPMGLFGQTYSDLWKQVQQAQNKDLPKTAISHLETIEKKAQAEKAYGQLMQSTLMHAKLMAEVASSKAFVDGSSAGEATNVGAIIDGTWDSAALEDMLGDNYACAALPSFEGADGKTYHMSGFSGNKLLGVKPQTEGGKLAMCYEIAKMLTDTDAQLERFNAQGWGPSNLKALADDAVKSDEALSALSEQFAYTIPQGQYPGEWWDLAGALGADVENGTLTVDSSDEDFMAELKTHDDTCASLIQ